MEEKLKILTKNIEDLQPMIVTLKDQVLIIKDSFLELSNPTTKTETADWVCEGRIWEGNSCHGCGNCNQKKTVIHEKKRRLICKSCKLDYDKYKRARKKAKSEVKEEI